MTSKEEEVRTRSMSSPSLPPPWVFSAQGRAETSYESDPTGSPLSDSMVINPALLDSIRPKSVPPEGGDTSPAPPKPPPLPSFQAPKDNRKYSRKYGSGIYSDASRTLTGLNPIETHNDYSAPSSGSISDAYGAPPIGFAPITASTSSQTGGYGLASALPSTSSGIERQEQVARERAQKEARAKLIGKLIHGLDSTQINEVLSMIMSPEQVESLKFYSDTAAKMRKQIEKKDWNKEFQKLLTRADDQLKFRKIYNLAHDFVYAASTYAKIIISELLLPESEKTIKPAALGGLAGGTKYVVQNIMFKFVLDFELKPGLWMYGSGDQRSDENAMKSASHELKGLMSYYSCNIRGLCFPLQALVDYKGFRVLAISILPINDDTIIYGSSDAGKTVHSRSPEFNEKIDTAARILNLKAHYVNPTVQLSGPGDLEGHLGTDGKFYVLDAARTLPPEGPDENPEFREDRQVYYKLLRPEFVRKWNQPLCSDAFTSWQRYDPNRTENNLEVLKATRYLHEKLIPKFAERLDKMASTGTTFADENKNDAAVSESFRLNRDLFAKKWALIQDRRQNENNDVNSAQVNTAFLGAANNQPTTARRNGSGPLSRSAGPGSRKRRNSLTLHNSLSSSHPSSSSGSDSRDVETGTKELDIVLMIEEMHRLGLNLRHLGEVRSHLRSEAPRQRILIEMVARVIKDMLRAQLRHKMGEVRVLSEEPFKEVVIKVFNFVLGRSPASASFWGLVKSKIQRKYKMALSSKEISEPDSMALCAKMDMAVLFRRLEHQLGISLTDSAREELESYPDSFEFVDSDVADIYPKVKHMQIVDHAEGMALFLTAQRVNVGRRERLRQLRLSCEKFARALTTLPDSFTTLYQWGLALIEEAHMSAAFGAMRLYLRASDKFKSAVTINPHFQACFIKLGEAYIELARAAMVASQNGQSLSLPELDDWEDSFGHEGSAITIHQTPPKSATKRYFVKATQAWDRGLSLQDFFFEEVYQAILQLHSDAVNTRESNRVRSRQLFYGSAILCEVVHNALLAHRELLLSTLLKSTARIDAHRDSLSHPGSFSNSASSLPPNIGAITQTSTGSLGSRSTPEPAAVGAATPAAAPSSLPSTANTSASSLNSPSTSFVYSSGISVAVPALPNVSTPRIKDVISVITPALKTRLQSTPSAIMSSPYATGLGDEFAAMKPLVSPTSAPTSTAQSTPQSNPIPFTTSVATTSRLPTATLSTSSPRMSYMMPAIAVVRQSPEPARHLEHSASASNVSPTKLRREDSNKVEHITLPVSTWTPTAYSPNTRPTSLDDISEHASLDSGSDSDFESGDTDSSSQSATPLGTTPPPSTQFRMEIPVSRARGVATNVPPLSLPTSTSPGLTPSKSAGNLYLHGITSHDAQEANVQEPVTPRKFKAALEAAPPTPYQRTASPSRSSSSESSSRDATPTPPPRPPPPPAPPVPEQTLPYDVSLPPHLSVKADTQLVMSPSTSLLVSQSEATSSAAGPVGSLRSVGLNIRSTKGEGRNPSPIHSHGSVSSGTGKGIVPSSSGHALAQPRPRRMRHSASVSSATSPVVNLPPKQTSFVQTVFPKPSPSPQPAVNAAGQYYGNAADDELQQLINLSQRNSQNLGAGSSGSSLGQQTSSDAPSFAVIAEAKFRPFLARADSPPIAPIRRDDKFEEQELYLKRIMLDILAIWSDSLIQYASLKKAGDEMLFLAGAVKLRDVLALDDSYLEIIQTKIIPELKFQARDNRRVHYVLAALHAVIHEHDPGNTHLIYDMGTSLHIYAQLHRLNPNKLALHRGEAAECFEEALSQDPTFADEHIHRAVLLQGAALESLLSIIEYSSAIESRTRKLWDERVTSVSLAGCASVHDFTLSKLVALCPHLKLLDLSRCIKVTDKGLIGIAKQATELTHLNLSECPGITDAGLQQFFLGQQDIGGCHLEHINLRGNLSITDAAVTQIAHNCPHLTHLDLEHCKTTNNAAVTLAQYPLPHLTYLSFALCVKLEDSGLAEMVRKKRFNLTTLKLNGCNMLSDAGIDTVVTGMPSLTELYLGNLYRISDASVAGVITKLPNLNLLDIRNCKGLSWAVFTHLPFDTPLKHLFASKMDPSGPSGRPDDTEMQQQRRAAKIAGMKVLCQNCAPSLISFEIGESAMPEETLYQLAQSITHRLTKLDLSGCAQMTDDLLTLFAPRVSLLTTLNLNACYQITSRGVSHIAQYCKDMRELYLSRVPENRETSILELIESMPRLRKLDLSGNMHVTDTILADMAAKLPQLDSLSLIACTKISDKGLRLITENLTNLTQLSIGGCLGVTNESLSSIAKYCKSLKDLNIARCSVTDPGLISLSEGVPVLRSIDLDNLSLITDSAVSHFLKHQDTLVEMSIKFCTKISGETKASIARNYPGLKLRVDPSNNSALVKELESTKLTRMSSANIENTIKSNQAAAAASSQSPSVSAELQSKFERLKSTKSSADLDINSNKPMSPTSLYDDPAIVRFTLAQLTSKDPVTANCNPQCLELYLDDEEFRKSFGMTKTEFSALIPWKKKIAKEAVKLF